MSQPEKLNEFPRDWDWKTDGNNPDGTYVKMSQAPTVHGVRPILVLNIDGEDRSIWVFWEALKNKLSQELQRRKAKDFNTGERIVIERFSMRKSKNNPTQDTVPFTVEFPDEPTADAASILGAGEPSGSPERVESAEPELPVSEADIPF